ncbi:transcriptional regulator, LysR family [Bordetella bronchiseptica MBORD665]|nr:transcriptional regulator, LysR family [Bordetella bronchiseptica MBORD665]
MALDRIEAMRAFCRIVELGSFTRAADSLGVASTTLSGQIQALERLLDIRLLHRSTRKVHPTNEGLAYYQRARKVIEDIDDLEASVSISRAVVKGRVAVEMPTPAGIHLVIPALHGFTERYPHIHLDIGCSERVVGLMQEGIDCAIRGGDIADQDLIARRVGQMRFCLCAAPAYLDAHPAITHPAQLARHRQTIRRHPAQTARQPPARPPAARLLQQRHRRHRRRRRRPGHRRPAARRSAPPARSRRAARDPARLDPDQHAHVRRLPPDPPAVCARAGFCPVGGGIVRGGWVVEGCVTGLRRERARTSASASQLMTENRGIPAH